MRPVTELQNAQALLQFANSKRLLRFASGQTLADTTALLYKIVRLSDKNLAIKAYLDLVREIQANEGHPQCFEDEFVLAVAYIDLEVGKLGAITYLKGESPDYKETKRHRHLLDTTDENVLKNLSAGLTRPNEERGSVEIGMIDSGHKRLAKMIDLHNAIPEVVKLADAGMTKIELLREVKIGLRREKLTLTDYDVICRMARREKAMPFKNRKRDPANSYELRTDNHERVKEIAGNLGMTPRRALNKILDDHFDMIAARKIFGSRAESPAKPPQKGVQKDAKGNKNG